MPLPISTQGMGMCMSFADICKVPNAITPFIIMTFPNIVYHAQFLPVTCAPTVFIQNKMVATINTKSPMSSGDQPGVLGGVISAINMGPSMFRQPAVIVKACGSPVVLHMSASAHNGTNSNAPAGLQLTPSQVTVFGT